MRWWAEGEHPCFVVFKHHTYLLAEHMKQSRVCDAPCVSKEQRHARSTITEQQHSFSILHMLVFRSIESSLFTEVDSSCIMLDHSTTSDTSHRPSSLSPASGLLISLKMLDSRPSVQSRVSGSNTPYSSATEIAWTRQEVRKRCEIRKSEFHPCSLTY